ncbi:MAG: vitamin K epoxide reductase family protein [Gammaproteobacteria bacterium]|nr:vitamin K epoxide reductase family protein [Gammaproteobacteria bacterium]
MSNAKKRSTTTSSKTRSRDTAAGTVAASAKVTSPGADRISLILASLGLLLSLYLLANHQIDGLPGCAAGGGCDRVQQSPWSMLWGYPVAAWGAATYLLLLGLAVWPKRRAGVAALPVVATIGFAISAYLTSITWHELKAWCPWCLASLALITVLSVRGWLRSEALLRPWLGILAILVSAGAITLVHQAQGGGIRTTSGLTPRVLQELADHLRDSGARFYGASWCGACAGQKAVFGSAGEALPYVECSPHGPGTPQSTDCLMAEIRTYPTWVIRGSKRPGALTPEQLAGLSGFTLPPKQDQ